MCSKSVQVRTKSVPEARIGVRRWKMGVGAAKVCSKSVQVRTKSVQNLHISL